MSNRITKSAFVPATPTLRIDNNPSPGIEKPPSTSLAHIVPKRFVKAVPPRSRIINPDTISDRSSSSSTSHEESLTRSEESSATIESEVSSLSESEQSSEKARSNANSEHSARLNTESPGTSGGENRLQTPWQPKITTHKKKLNALELKKKHLKRQDAQPLLLESNSSSEPSGKSEPLPNTTKFDRPLLAETNSNQNKRSSAHKKTILDLIPTRRKEKLAMPTKAVAEDKIADTNALQAFGMSMKSTMKSLRKSDLYRDASMKNEHLATLRPLVLESYLSSLLKDAGARETIGKYKLNADEVVAIRWYGREGFQYVQQSLREKPDPSLGEDNVVAPPKTFENLIKACESGFAKLPPLLGTELFRGTNFLFDDNLNPGDSYTDPAFVSTSTSKEIAEQRFSGSFLLKFTNVAKDDARWRDISSLTGNSKEAEVLCLPNTSFRVVSRGEGAKQGARAIDNPEIITLEPIFN